MVEDMPVALAQKVQALRVDFRSAAQLADMLGVSRSQVTRWLRGAGIDPLNAEKVDLLELVWSNVLRIYERDAALAWLFGVNPLLGDRRPIDLIRLGRTEELMRAIRAERSERSRDAFPVDPLPLFRLGRRAARPGPDGPLWFPRVYQGEGRHDNPDGYGCLYLSTSPLSTVVEQLARFRGQRLLPSLLRRRGLPLALAELELDDGASSSISTIRRSSAASGCGPRGRDARPPYHPAAGPRLHDRHPPAAGLRWWSTYEPPGST